MKNISFTIIKDFFIFYFWCSSLSHVCPGGNISASVSSNGSWISVIIFMLLWSSDFCSGTSSSSKFLIIQWNVGKSAQTQCQIFTVPRWWILTTLMSRWSFFSCHKQTFDLVLVNFLTKETSQQLFDNSLWHSLNIHFPLRMNYNNCNHSWVFSSPGQHLSLCLFCWHFLSSSLNIAVMTLLSTCHNSCVLTALVSADLLTAELLFSPLMSVIGWRHHSAAWGSQSVSRIHKTFTCCVCVWWHILRGYTMFSVHTFTHLNWYILYSGE